MQPKDSRLKLEVEVANDNALHWKEGLNKANIRTAELRTEKLRLRALLRAVNLLLHGGDIVTRTTEAESNAKEISRLIEKELG